MKSTLRHINPLLKQGDQGPAVLTMQQLINRRLAELVPSHG